MLKYLNPYTDFGFKKLFSKQFLPAYHQVAEWQLNNTENLFAVPLDRRAIFDIRRSGERFIVDS